jgi:hypothetical protein
MHHLLDQLHDQGYRHRLQAQDAGRHFFACDLLRGSGSSNRDVRISALLADLGILQDLELFLDPGDIILGEQLRDRISAVVEESGMEIPPVPETSR